jgi:hypothetical protein
MEPASSLQRSVREALQLGQSDIRVEHLMLALLAMNQGAVPILSLGASPATLRAAALGRYRQPR